MNTTDIAFIGFGEAAWHLCRSFGRQPSLRLRAFDTALADRRQGPVMESRANQANVTLCHSLAEACEGARFVICLTSAGSALLVAQEVLPLLTPGQHYIDMNSASPMVKQAIDRLPRPKGVGFCDAAVMGTVPSLGHQVPVLLAGNAAVDFAAELSPFGMKLTVLPGEAGAASALKMLKSVVMKGLPQLFLEAFCAAEKAGVLDALVASLSQSLNGKTVEALAETFCYRTLQHAGRRSAEMADVVATLESLGADASMSITTRQKLDTLAQQHRIVPGSRPLSWRDTISILTHSTGEPRDDS